MLRPRLASGCDRLGHDGRPDIASPLTVTGFGAEACRTLTEPRHEGAGESEVGNAGSVAVTPPPGQLSVQRLALVSIVTAFMVFVAIRLGPALIGLKTFSGVDILTAYAPWDDRWLTETWQSPWVGDTIDSLLPNYVEAHLRLWSGDIPWWSTTAASGSPLLGSLNTPFLTPSNVGMLLAPTVWAVGFAKLVQLAMAFVGMMLWLRRLGTTWAAGAMAGLLYCSSGFFVAWSGWLPQAGVTATIPALFWAIERFIALRTARSALVISVVVAWLLLGGFPAVAGHALYAGAVYFLVRTAVERRTLKGRGLATTIGGGAAAVALGIGLSAIQLLPLVRSLAEIDTGYRASQFDGRQPTRSLMSVFFPRIFNSDGVVPQSYGLNTNPPEAYAYLGIGAVALAVLALLAGRWHGVSRGVVPVLTVIGLLAAALTWRHGFWTDWLRNVPVFADNNSGRLRDMVAVAGCALAGIGFNLLFRHQLPRWVQLRLVGGAWIILGVAATATVLAFRRYAEVVDDGTFLIDAGLGLLSTLLVALAFTVAHGRPHAQRCTPPASSALAVSSAADVRSTADGPPGTASSDPISAGAFGSSPARSAPTGGGRRQRNLLASTIFAIAAVTGIQAFSSTAYFWPLSDVDDFYPETAGVLAAQQVTGSDRALSGDGTFLGSSSAANDIRTLTGHAFPAETWKDYLLALDSKAFTGPGRSPTNPRVSFSTADQSLQNPLLDRLAVRTALTSPNNPVPGPVLDRRGAPHTPETDTAGQAVTVGSTEVPAGSLTPQPLRGILVQVVEPGGDGVHGVEISVVLRDPTGREISRGGVIRSKWAPGWTQISVAGEDLAGQKGPLSVSVSVSARDVPGQTLDLRADGDQVQILVIGSQQDGLRLAYTDASLQVWERPTALPRIRWASGSIVIDQPAARLAALADPTTPTSTVVLSAPGPGASGAAARLSVSDDSGDRVAVDVQAEGAGYLVVADAIQSGWAVTVNGEPANLVDADHAVGAVYVPAGASTVVFQYVGTGLRTGAAVTAVSFAIFLFVLIFPPLFRRLRRRGAPVS